MEFTNILIQHEPEINQIRSIIRDFERFDSGVLIFIYIINHVSLHSSNSLINRRRFVRYSLETKNLLLSNYFF